MMSSSTPLRILGVDPGTNFLGYAVVDVLPSSMKMVIVGALNLKALAVYEKLGKIHHSMESIIRHYKPAHLAIESPFFGKNVQSMLKLGRAQGIVIGLASSAGMDVYEYAPLRVKQMVTGKGGASKAQVLQTLAAIFDLNAQADALFDESDALAVAYCHHLEMGTFRHPSLALALEGKKKKTSNPRKAWTDFLKNNPINEP